VNLLTEDCFLHGRIAARQPMRGFRSGLDAVMLAAAVPAADDDDVLELGSGAGVASLCLGARCASCRVTGLETILTLVELANANARVNGLEGRTRFVVGDALAPPTELRRSFDHVFANPPFHDNTGDVSPDGDRAAALTDNGRLDEWLLSGLQRVRSRGTFTTVLRADRLAQALAHLPALGTTVFPLWPRIDQAAKRVIVQVRKGSRAPLSLLPGLVLHEADGGYTPAADAVLRGGGSLALGSRSL
jgi:tRNA1Val (adenine37-N6)-methyltransferase